MFLEEIVSSLELEQVTAMKDLHIEVEGGFACDLLSNVMGQAEGKMIWVTMQGHRNIAAIASLIGISAIIVTGGTTVEEDTLHLAKDNDLPIFITGISTYDVVGKLYTMGVVNANARDNM